MEYGDQFLEQARGHLTSGEQVRGHVLGFFEIIHGQDIVTKYGVLFATNKKIVVVLAKKLFGHELENFSFSDIVAVELQQHQGLALALVSPNKTVRTKVIHAGDIVGFVKYVTSRMERRRPAIETVSPPVLDLAQQKFCIFCGARIPRPGKFCGQCGGALVPSSPAEDVQQPPLQPVGVVYLLKAGPFYKIGKANNLEKRIRQIKLQLPYPVEVIHTIETYAASKAETYWHRRFKSKRTNGEWFVLTDEDVAEFMQHRSM